MTPATYTFAERAARLKQIDERFEKSSGLDVKTVRELLREEDELISEPFMVNCTRDGEIILIDPIEAVHQIAKYFNCLTHRHILSGLARGGEFKTKTATYKAAE